MSHENRDIFGKDKLQTQTFDSRAPHFKIATPSNNSTMIGVCILIGFIAALIVFGSLSLITHESNSNKQRDVKSRPSEIAQAFEPSIVEETIPSSGFYLSTYFGINYLAVDPSFPTQIGNTFIYGDLSSSDLDSDNDLSAQHLNVQIPKSKIASVQGPIIPSDENSTIILQDDISNRCYWTTFSFNSNPLPNPLALKFKRPNHTKIYPNWRPALALSDSFRPGKSVIIDQLDRFDSFQLKVRFSVARPISKITWDKDFPEIRLPVAPAAILTSKDKSLVLSNSSKSFTLRMRSLADLPSDSIILSLSSLEAPPFSMAPDWIIQRTSDQTAPNYQVYLANGRDITKLTKYLSKSPDFSIKKGTFDRSKAGTFLIEDGKIMVAIFGKEPTQDEIKALAKASRSKFAYSGRSDDYIALPSSVRDRVRMVSEILSQIESAWLIESNRIIPVTKDDMDNQPALIGSLIRRSDGLLLHPLSIISVYN